LFVHSEAGFFYIVSPVKRYRVTTRRVLDSWSPQRVVETSEAALSKYRVVSKLRFRNGSLLRSVSSGKMYFISDGKRRHIQGPDVFDRLQIEAVFGQNTFINVSPEELELHPEGAPLK
jgi:hypothetical protein